MNEPTPGSSANCPEGKDYNAADMQHSREQKDDDWETSVKMALIARDLMIGNPRLAELGFGEEALGHNAIASGFQGQRQWTDYPAQRRLHRSDPQLVL